jgi:hypothetical protein
MEFCCTSASSDVWPFKWLIERQIDVKHKAHGYLHISRIEVISEASVVLISRGVRGEVI